MNMVFRGFGQAIEKEPSMEETAGSGQKKIRVVEC